jgi:outer membrane receptor protein involved in Fe transport
MGAHERLLGVGASLDIELRDAIASLGSDTIFDHIDVLGPGRGPPDSANPTLRGRIRCVVVYQQNVGRLKTAGFDIDLRARTPVLSLGRLSVQFEGTYVTDGNPVSDDMLRRVGSYSVWDVQAGYSGVRNLTVTFGIKNLFDRNPPFTNSSFNGYDPAYADPRGRTLYTRLGYAFK